MNKRIQCRSQRVLPAVCILAVLGGCTIVPPIEGDGNVQTETRDLDPITAVENYSPVDVQVRSGQDQAVEITCDNNLLQYIHTEVSGNTLDIRIVIEDQDAVTIAPTGICLVAVDVPLLERYRNRSDGDADLSGALDGLVEIRNSGSGGVVSTDISTGDLDLQTSSTGGITVSGTVSAEDFSVEVRGSGSVSLGDVSAITVFFSDTGTGGLAAGLVEADEVSIESSAAGDLRIDGVYTPTLSVANDDEGTITLGAGEADVFDLVLSGAGDVNAKGVVVSRLTATLSGSGDATVTVLDEVDATLTGSGDLIVYGDPPLRHETATDGGQVVYQ